jgi:hypothetical protein
LKLEALKLARAIIIIQLLKIVEIKILMVVKMLNWVDGWVELIAVIRIDYINQTKTKEY